MQKLFLAMAIAIVTGTAVSAQKKENMMVVSSVQTDKDSGYEGNSAIRCGIRFNIKLSGVTKIELESVDGNPLAGKANIKEDATAEVTEDASTIITFEASDKSGFTPGKDYYIPTLPCDLYGGYRLSFYKDGLVADYFGVHQTVTLGTFITPGDLVENELEFDEPDAPFVEKEKPKMDAMTHKLFIQYRRKPTEANKQALLERMGIRYDKVVARKKNKLRELEREARTYAIVEHMQGIVDEMVENRDIRIQQQFVRFIDPRRDENPDDTWMVLRGASAQNAYIGYAPVTNAEYAAFNAEFVYDKGKDNYPVVGVSIKDAEAYCNWLTAKDPKHTYRLPSEEEWILAAGHMPKDVAMNSDHVECGLTAVDAYAQSKGACGGIDFWGNCWEWTSSTDKDGLYIIKGGSWDSDRDDCRSEKSDDVRNSAQSYANVGFRVVRVNDH
nr:SUMF1/EgtB/PvdO family nonheme iron enzyme [Bacteroides intestinalis]